MTQKGTHTSLLTLNTHTDNRSFRSTSSMSSRLGWWIWRRGGRTALSSCRCNVGFPLCSNTDSARFGVLSTCTWCSGFVAARSWCPPYFHWGWGCWCCHPGQHLLPFTGPQSVATDGGDDAVHLILALLHFLAILMQQWDINVFDLLLWLWQGWR